MKIEFTKEELELMLHLVGQVQIRPSADDQLATGVLVNGLTKKLLEASTVTNGLAEVMKIDAGA